MVHNTQNLKAALQVLINTSMTVDKALADNKITPLEWAQIAIKSIAFWRVIRNIDPVKDEFLKLTPEARADLIQWSQTQFDLRNDQLEHIIESLFTAILEMSAVLIELREKAA